jgi:hypothetical protein
MCRKTLRAMDGEVYARKTEDVMCGAGIVVLVEDMSCF